MKKSNFSVTVTILLFIGTIACSLLSGVFILPAIILFAALCIGFPSPFLTIAPLVSIAATLFLNHNSNADTIIFSCAISIFYILPSVLIAWGYFKKQSKAMVVLNGAIGIFMYACVMVVVSVILVHGAFTPQILNSVIDAQLPTFTEYMMSQLSVIQASEPAVSPDVIEEVFFMSKPLLPATMAAAAVFVSYISVCFLNLILKKTRIIDNKSYRVVLHWGLGIIFIFCTFFGTLGSLKSYASILAASFTMVFALLFFIVGTGVIFDSLNRLFKTRSTLFISVIFIVILLVVSTLASNLFYLVGAYYSVINGIKNRKINRFKGGKQ